MGLLALFDCFDTCVPHPNHEGIALVDDCAANSDPSYGCGLSLALRDVHILQDLLLTEGDWDKAGHTYVAEHDRYYGSIHCLTDWTTRLFYEPGPEAARRRARALARISGDLRRAIDIPGLGPESPSDEAAYRDLFGDEE